MASDIRTPPSNENYRSGWDRVFRGKKSNELDKEAIKNNIKALLVSLNTEALIEPEVVVENGTVKATVWIPSKTLIEPEIIVENGVMKATFYLSKA